MTGGHGQHRHTGQGHSGCGRYNAGVAQCQSQQQQAAEDELRKKKGNWCSTLRFTSPQLTSFMFESCKDWEWRCSSGQLVTVQLHRYCSAYIPQRTLLWQMQLPMLGEEGCPFWVLTIWETFAQCGSRAAAHLHCPLMMQCTFLFLCSNNNKTFTKLKYLFMISPSPV